MLLRVRLGDQCTGLALPCALKMNKLHSYNSTNEEKNVRLNLKRRHINAFSSPVGSSMEAPIWTVEVKEP